MKHAAMTVSFLVWAVACRADTSLYNPYERSKNGPPLKNIFQKATPDWIFRKLSQSKHHPAARMPEFKFSEDEVLDIMAYLKSIAEPIPVSPVSWPAWANKDLDDLSDDESTVVFDLLDKGKRIWNTARCSICHTINGPGGALVGGYVDLRVGCIDLQIAGAKLQRDWLYRWLQEPKQYFPTTLMPRYRFAAEEVRALTEYILRDDVFRPPDQTPAEQLDPQRQKALDEPERAARGKRLIELSRCVLCHDIQGIADLLPQPPPKPPPPGSFEFLAHDVRCLSCHSIEGQGGTYAPDLTSEGNRLHTDWIANYVRAPDIIRPLSQQMPKFNLTEDEAKLIAAYMEKNRRDSRIPEHIPGGVVTPEEIDRGQAIYQAKGCSSCHSLGAAAGGVVGPSLEAAGNRLRAGYIWYHLKNPHAVNPYSAEPNYGLTDKETRELATFLSSKKR